MTLIQAINRVLVRMREDEVSNPASTSYSKLIAQFVNDAKREIENAHAWASLKTLVDASVVAADTSVSFTGTNKRTRIVDIYNDTDDQKMIPRTREQIIRYRETGNSQSGRPDWWAYAGHNANGHISIELWPTSDGSYTLTADCLIPQEDIANGDTEITVPGEPVYLRALALALAERGDDQGQSYAQIMNEYQMALNDAVVQDKDNSRYDDSWYTP